PKTTLRTQELPNLMQTFSRLAPALVAAFCCLTIVAAAPHRHHAPMLQEATAKVAVSNTKFEPRTLRVKAGTTVVWENTEGAHTVTADNGAFESDTLSEGESYSHKFDKPGRYPYYCNFHGSKGGHDMAGIVIVTK